MKIKMHWDRQAAKGEASGTQDRIAKTLEMKAISKFVRDGMRVLDVGCGDGEMLLHLAFVRNLECAWGIDFSEEMIAQAKNKLDDHDPTPSNIFFQVGDIKILPPKPSSGLFDLIYTERTLINLASWEEQRQAITDIGSLLKPGGLYLMCECFKEGLRDINLLRNEVGLESITEPWHNRYLTQDEIIPDLKNIPGLMLEDRIDYSANYYFLSRVVEAYVAREDGREPDYNSAINRIGPLLQTQVACNRGQGQLWVWRKNGVVVV